MTVYFQRKEGGEGNEGEKGGKGEEGSVSPRRPLKEEEALCCC